MAESDLSCDLWDLLLQHTDSLAGVCGLQSSWTLVVAMHRLSCSVACGILVPQPGIKPSSPALKGGFLTTGPPRKSLYVVIDLTWIITMPALGPGLSLTSRYLLQGQVNLHKAQLQSVSPLLSAFWILCCVFLCRLVELSSVMEMFYTVQYVNHHHLWLWLLHFFPLLINLYVNSHVWLIARQYRKPIGVCHLRLPLALCALPAAASALGIFCSRSFKSVSWVFLAVQWLGLGTFPAGAQGQFLGGELRSCKLHGSAKK